MSFVKPGEYVKAKVDIDDFFKKNKKYQVQSIRYNRDIKTAEIELVGETGDKRFIQPSRFILPKLTVLGQDFQYNQKVRFFVKPINLLMKEGWESLERGGLRKSSAYYRFTKKKVTSCGRVLTGHIRVNPNFKVCLRDEESGWHFDESMIKYILTDLFDFENVEECIDGISFKGPKQGRFYIGDYRFSIKGSRKILDLLLKHHKWIKERPDGL